MTPVLITNYHVVNDAFMNQNTKLTFYIKNDLHSIKIDKDSKNNNNKNQKININIKMKNPLLNSIMKNYKSIIDINKSIEFIRCQRKSSSKDKNSYSAKHRLKKNNCK